MFFRVPRQFPLRPSSRSPGAAVAFDEDRFVLRTSDGRLWRCSLPAGLLTASPTEPNCASPSELARAIRDGLTRLGQGDRRPSDAVIALPDRAVHAGFTGSARSAAVRNLRSELIGGLVAAGAARSAGLDARFRFGNFSTGRWRERSTLGAVSGVSVVSQYEAVAEAAGLRSRWTDATSLAVLPEWLAASAGGADRRILLLLHRRHFVLAQATGQRLTGFRLKLRAELDPEPPLLAVRRLGEPKASRLSVLGEGARRLGAALDSAGFPVRDIRDGGGADGDVEDRSGISPVTRWALAALLRRAGMRAAPLVPDSGGTSREAA